MSAHELVQLEGTFEYIEAKIRRDADGTAFGGDFEWLCQWFLLNAPRYRGQFENVWLWNEWPDRWGAEAGIDLVARTRTGELWAIQAKADHPDRAIPKREIDSFLSESSRPEFVYRLLMATTDDIGRNARRTLEAQEKPVGLVLRGHFLTEEVVWPVKIGGTAEPLPRLDPRPHQATAIRDVLAGFQIHDRGQLIMAGGTGKTLTALWIAEQLQSSLTLVLVPSLSLVAQNLREWGRNTASAFDQLVVCSDESVVQRKEDAAIQSTADLGVKVTTDPLVIRHFLDRATPASGCRVRHVPVVRSTGRTGQVDRWQESTRSGSVSIALRSGLRGLPGGSSLARLLAEHRGVRNPMNLSPLTIEQILVWADAHKAAIGDWPNQHTGQVTGTDETWAGINDALRSGHRGLPGGSSLATFLADHRDLRNPMNLPPLSIEEILVWADAYKATTGDWPNKASGQVTGTDETWDAINHSLTKGHTRPPRRFVAGQAAGRVPRCAKHPRPSPLDRRANPGLGRRTQGSER